MEDTRDVDEKYSYVSCILERMEKAYMMDKSAVEKEIPALNRLKASSSILSLSHKDELVRIFFKLGGLNKVLQWLSLPTTFQAVTVAVLEMLIKMPDSFIPEAKKMGIVNRLDNLLLQSQNENRVKKVAKRVVDRFRAIDTGHKDKRSYREDESDDSREQNVKRHRGLEDSEQNTVGPFQETLKLLSLFENAVRILPKVKQELSNYSELKKMNSRLQMENTELRKKVTAMCGTAGNPTDVENDGESDDNNDVKDAVCGTAGNSTDVENDGESGDNNDVMDAVFETPSIKNRTEELEKIKGTLLYSHYAKCGKFFVKSPDPKSKASRKKWNVLFNKWIHDLERSVRI